MTRTLDPRKYEIKPASIDEIIFRKLIEREYSEMQRIGFRLSQLDILPLTEEPKGSGRKVTTGNYSVRVPERGFLVTGSGVNKTDLLPEGILYVEDIDYDTGTYFIAGNTRPSRETLIHDKIYKERPDVNVILHIHDKTALKYGKSRKTQRPIFFANAEEADEVVETLGDADYVSLPTHGQFVVGRNIEDTLYTAEKYHRNAFNRTPSSRFFSATLATAMAASVALMIGAGIAEYRRSSNCREIESSFGTSEICPQKVRCYQDPLLIEEDNRDGTHTCIYSMIGPS